MAYPSALLVTQFHGSREYIGDNVLIFCTFTFLPTLPLRPLRCSQNLIIYRLEVVLVRRKTVMIVEGTQFIKRNPILFK